MQRDSDAVKVVFPGPGLSADSLFKHADSVVGVEKKIGESRKYVLRGERLRCLVMIQKIAFHGFDFLRSPVIVEADRLSDLLNVKVQISGQTTPEQQERGNLPCTINRLRYYPLRNGDVLIDISLSMEIIGKGLHEVCVLIVPRTKVAPSSSSSDRSSPTIYREPSVRDPKALTKGLRDIVRAVSLSSFSSSSSSSLRDQRQQRQRQASAAQSSREMKKRVIMKAASINILDPIKLESRFLKRFQRIYATISLSNTHPTQSITIRGLNFLCDIVSTTTSGTPAADDDDDERGGRGGKGAGSAILVQTTRKPLDRYFVVDCKDLSDLPHTLKPFDEYTYIAILHPLSEAESDVFQRIQNISLGIKWGPQLSTRTTAMTASHHSKMMTSDIATTSLSSSSSITTSSTTAAITQSGTPPQPVVLPVAANGNDNDSDNNNDRKSSENDERDESHGCCSTTYVLGQLSALKNDATFSIKIELERRKNQGGRGGGRKAEEKRNNIAVVKLLEPFSLCITVTNHSLHSKIVSVVCSSSNSNSSSNSSSSTAAIIAQQGEVDLGEIPGKGEAKTAVLSFFPTESGLHEIPLSLSDEMGCTYQAWDPIRLSVHESPSDMLSAV
mmetsp:Transcript_25288/g.40823  ORF Transcript_25288/g.40823 Transcript_25288/m.40823 type:complete len:614 (+) Transcript_25288:162-2003(+)